VYLLLGAGFWSLGGFFIKEIDAGAASITFYRCLFAAAWLAVLVPGRRFPRAGDMVFSIVLFATLLALYVGSTKATTAANAVFLQYTAPIYVALLAPFVLGEGLRSRELAPLGICVAGILVLFAGNQGSGDTVGLWLGLGSGFTWGLFLLWLRRMRHADPVALTFGNCAGVVLLFLAVPGVWEVSLRDLGLLVVMGGVQFALPYVLFTRGIKEVPGAEASLIALLEPVLNPVWVSLLIGEDPSLATIAGGAVILGGLVLRYTVFRAPSELAAGAGEGGATVPRSLAEGGKR
jgi:drug/metabolite transporter (DMT)-like permease